MAKQDDYMKTALRLPRELHAQILEAAIKQGKSLNTVMIERLQASFTTNTVTSTHIPFGMDPKEFAALVAAELAPKKVKK